MKKIILVASVIMICFAVSASAATSFSVDVDSVNTEMSENKVVIYTSEFGETILSGEINDDHGFRDHYVVTVIPRVNDDISMDVSEESSVVDESILPEISTDVSEVTSSDEISSESAAETAASSEFDYEVSGVYLPGTQDKDVKIPENGFVIAFPASKGIAENKVWADKIAVGDGVSVGGVDLEKLSVSDGAYVEFDLSEKNLLGDIPQTSDRRMTAVFTVIAVLSGVAAYGIYKKNKKFEEE